METNKVSISQSFFQANYDDIQFAVIFGGMVFFFLLEGLIPRRKNSKPQGLRLFSNIGLALFNHFFLFAYAILITSIISKYQPESSLVSHFKLSHIPAFILVFFTMELVTYSLHRIYHKVPILWKIHAVHHSDTEFDVTTSHRNHPFEAMIHLIIISPIIYLLGVPFIALAIYNLLHTASSLFNHSNIVLSERVDKILRLFLMTPDYHRVHHSSDKPFTNSNYGTIVPWFDYLFKTSSKKPFSEMPEMEVGLEVLRKTEDQRLDKLLTMPFRYKPVSRTNAE